MNAPPELIAGRYKLLRRIGNGNMSEVYHSEDIKHGNQVVAVKLLNTRHKDEIKQELYRRETAALDRLEHPNVVKHLDYGWSDQHQCHYLVFEYLPRTLAQEIENHKESPDRNWCWPLLRDITDALMHAHAKGIIHRDLKSSNILLTEAGVPKLTDFGISLLRFEVERTGITLAAYWSEGYAAPEQRSMQKATEQSDIYSLGCVFYYVLSGQEPPPTGLIHEHIQALKLPALIEQMFQRMLDIDAKNRFASVEQLVRFLEFTKKLQSYPEVYFRLTDKARANLVDAALFSGSSFEAACRYLNTLFVHDGFPQEVQLALEGNLILVLTDILKLVCLRDQDLPLLTVIEAHAHVYLPEHERQRSQASFCRYHWHFLKHSSELPIYMRADFQATIDNIVRNLTEEKRTRLAQKKQKSERKDFTKLWNKILDVQQELLDNAPKLKYQNWRREGNTITFELDDPVPDSLLWPESVPIALLNDERLPLKIGLLMSVSGLEVQVSWAAIQEQELYPLSGTIGLFQVEAQSALDRQKRALEMLISGGTVNPRLPDVLKDLSTALFDELDDTLVFEQTLGEDKQNAVRRALATRDIFLLQGPPGTGKTTTLAEIIVQILRINPTARILVSSQSNVAVNHVLSRVSDLQKMPGIVRLGRSDKIKEGAQEWTLEYQLGEWRKEVVERTNAVISELEQEIRQLHHSLKRDQVFSSTQMADIEQCKMWLEELISDLDDLADYERRVERFTEHLDPTNRVPERKAQEIRIELHEYQERSRKQREYISSMLELVRSSLPTAWNDPIAASLAGEHKRLSQLAIHLLSPSTTDSQEEKLLRLVRSWQSVFGKRRDFSDFLFERARILAATCLIAGSRQLRDEEFDWAIIDEAGRATATELLVPLVRARRAIIVGDEKQLPPMVEAGVRDGALANLNLTKKELERSLFETLVEQGKEDDLPVVQMLTEQHRMHPAIGKLVSNVFYDGKLKHAVDPRQRNHQLRWLNHAVVWYSTTALPKHSEKSRGSSFYNPTEVEAIAQLVKRLEKSYQDMGIQRDLAILTPYNQQIFQLRDRIRPTSASWLALSIEIATIDAFQGRDSHIVIYSTVRSNEERKLGFLQDRRRLNVALSRAQQLLILVGDIWMLASGHAGKDGNPYEELFRYMRDNPDDCLIQNLQPEDLHEQK